MKAVPISQHKSANIVERSLIAMRANTGSTVARFATTTQDTIDELNERLIRYHTCIALLKPLVDTGKLSKGTYTKMCTTLATNIGFSKSSIWISPN